MINLAQIGCGYWGPNLLRNFSALPDARVKYVVEQSEARRRYVEANYPKSQAIADLATIWSDPEVNAIIIATPAQSHFALAQKALQSNKHVFVEKPLAMTVGEVDQLTALAEPRQLTVMPGHTFLYVPAVLRLKQMIEAGELGRIYYLYAQRLNLGVVRNDINALWNLAPHDVSIFNFLLGSAPIAASAHGTDYLQRGIEDVVFANFEYPNQVRASVQVSWLDPNKVRKITIVGSRKMVVYDDVADDKLTIYDKGIDRDGGDQPLPFDQPAVGKLIYRSGDIYLPKLTNVEPLREEARDFVDSILKKRTPRSDARSGRAVVAALEAAAQSLRQNSSRIALPSGLAGSAA